MTTSPLVRSAAALALVAACTSSDDGPAGLEVAIGDVRLPVVGAAYQGSSPHLFASGAARLTCSSHGVLTDGVEPPLQIGTSVVASYDATFVGELVLQPPLVRTPATYALQVGARMAERITLRTPGETRWVFDTELVTFELGDGLPAGVRVRESPSLASLGVTTLSGSAAGLTGVQTHYDVWLELTVDDGQSWIPADGAVRMTLQSN